MPKSSGLICTSYILTMQTHMVSFASFALTRLSFALSFFFFFFWSLIFFPFLPQMPQTYALFALTLLLCRAAKGECRKRLRMTGRPGGGQRMEPLHRSTDGQVPEDLQGSTLQHVRLCTWHGGSGRIWAT